MNTQDRNSFNQYDEDVIDLYELWQTIWKRKKFITIFCSAAVVLTAIVSLIMSPIFRAESTVLPISSKTNLLGGMSDLAALAGMSLGAGGDDTTKILAVLNSRTIKEIVITELDLIKVIFEDGPPENRNPMLATIEKFEDMVTVTSDKKSGLITIAFENKDPELSKKVVESYVRNLKDILNTKSLSVNKMKREFLEQQLKNADLRLKKGQSKMQRFQEKSKILEPKEQSKGAISFYTQLIAKRTELEVKKESMESALAPGSPMLKAIETQLKMINQRIRTMEGKGENSAIPSLGNAPGKLSRYADHYRELEVSATIYKTLLQLYEQSKLEEAQESLFVQVIDPPVLPDRKVKPKRALMVVVAGFTSLFMSIFIVFFIEWLENIKEEKQAQF